MTEKHPVSEALRAEILKLATDGDPGSDGALTAGVLLRIVRVAKTGRDLMVSLETSPSNLANMVGRPNLPGLPGLSLSPAALYGDDGDGSIQAGSFGMTYPYAQSAPSENFGMAAIREIIAAVKSHVESKNTPAVEYVSVVELVEALAVAKKEGLDDVARELESQLKAQKPAPVAPKEAQS